MAAIVAGSLAAAAEVAEEGATDRLEDAQGLGTTAELSDEARGNAKARNFWTRTQLFAAFDEIDVARSGAIDHDELERVLEKLGLCYEPVQIALLRSKLDHTGGGTIDRDEFTTLLSSIGVTNTCLSKVPSTSHSRKLANADCIEARSSRDSASMKHSRTSDAFNTKDMEDLARSAQTIQQLEEPRVQPPVQTLVNQARTSADAHAAGETVLKKNRHRKDRIQGNISRLLKHVDAAAEVQTIDEKTITRKTPKGLLGADCMWSKHKCRTIEFAQDDWTRGDAKGPPRLRTQSDEVGKAVASVPSNKQQPKLNQHYAEFTAGPAINIADRGNGPVQDASAQKPTLVATVDVADAPVVLPCTRKSLGRDSMAARAARVIRRSQTHTGMESVACDPPAGATFKRTQTATLEFSDPKRGRSLSQPPLLKAEEPSVPTHISFPNRRGGVVAFCPVLPASGMSNQDPMSASMAWQHLQCIQRKKHNQAMQKKLRLFDLRHQQNPKNTEDAGGRRSSQNDGAPSEHDRMTAQEVELGFHIVAWSSQKGKCAAKHLLNAHGKWETFTRPGSLVQNEYLVFGIHGHPNTVTGVELTMNGTITNPRRCKVQHSEAQQGPWNDAWNFIVESKSEHTWHARHEYGVLTKRFKQMLMDFSGNLEIAWSLMDSNNTGILSKAEFEDVCLRVNKLCGTSGTALIEPNKLFRDLDVENQGTISVEQIFSDEVRMPVAPFWRLLIVDNWGSPHSVVLANPLRLFSTVNTDLTSHTSGKQAYHETTKFMEEMVLALQPTVMHMTPEERMLRRMSNEYSIDYEEVAKVYVFFQTFDDDGTNSLERSEFEELLIKIHGVQDKSELPQTRLDFFWRQADEDGSGSINFEEFLVWHTKKNPLRNSAQKTDDSARQPVPKAVSMSRDVGKEVENIKDEQPSSRRRGTTAPL